MTSVGNLVLGMGIMPAGGTPSFSTGHSLDANNDAVGYAIQARDTDPITAVRFRYGSRTGTPPSYVATLESLDASTGMPDGVDVGGGSPTAKIFTPPANATWDATLQTVTWTNPYTPTSRGQILVPTIRYSSGTVDASNFSSFNSHVTTTTQSGVTAQFPRAFRLTAGTWANQGSLPLVSLITASSRYGYPAASLYNTRSASTVGHRQALKFTIPSGPFASYKVIGVRVVASIAAAAGKTPILGLWSAAGVLQSITLDSDHVSDATTLGNYQYLFDETSLSALTPGTAYYIGFEVADAANGGVILYGFNLGEAGDLDAWPGGSNQHFATFDGSTWSDVTTVRPFVQLIIDDITAASGGGHPKIGPGPKVR